MFSKTSFYSVLLYYSYSTWVIMLKDICEAITTHDVTSHMRWVLVILQKTHGSLQYSFENAVMKVPVVCREAWIRGITGMNLRLQLIRGDRRSRRRIPLAAYTGGSRCTGPWCVLISLWNHQPMALIHRLLTVTKIYLRPPIGWGRSASNWHLQWRRRSCF